MFLTKTDNFLLGAGLVGRLNLGHTEFEVEISEKLKLQRWKNSPRENYRNMTKYANRGTQPQLKLKSMERRQRIILKGSHQG